MNNPIWLQEVNNTKAKNRGCNWYLTLQAFAALAVTSRCPWLFVSQTVSWISMISESGSTAVPQEITAQVLDFFLSGNKEGNPFKCEVLFASSPINNVHWIPFWNSKNNESASGYTTPTRHLTVTNSRFGFENSTNSFWMSWTWQGIFQEYFLKYSAHESPVVYFARSSYLLSLCPESFTPGSYSLSIPSPGGLYMYSARKRRI